MQNKIIEIIKEAINKIEIDGEDFKNQVSAILKLCEIALKYKKIEEIEKEDEDFKEHQFNEVELEIIEDYVKKMKKKG